MTVLLSSTLRVGYSGRKTVCPTSLGSLDPDNTPQRSSLLPIRCVHKQLVHQLHCRDVSGICASTQRIWAPPLLEVLCYSASNTEMWSKYTTECNVRIVPRTATCVFCMHYRRSGNFRVAFFLHKKFLRVLFSPCVRNFCMLNFHHLSNRQKINSEISWSTVLLFTTLPIHKIVCHTVMNRIDFFPAFSLDKAVLVKIKARICMHANNLGIGLVPM